MAAKQSKATLSRQRSAARKAHESGRWETAVANYSRALAHKELPTEGRIELLEGRSDCYRKLGDFERQIKDLQDLLQLKNQQLQDQRDNLRQSLAEVDILSSVAEALVQQVDYEEVGRLVGAKVQEFFNAEITGVAFYDERAGLLNPVYYYERGKLKDVPPFKYGEGISSHVIKTRKPIYLATAKESDKAGAIYSDELVLGC